MTSLHRPLALLVGLMLVFGVGVVPVAAHDRNDLPARIDLPDGWQPEGIESNGSGRLYVGSLKDGAIWTGKVRTGEGRILVPGVAGRVAVGLHLDHRGRLWVAGGPTGTIRVYKARTGELLQTYQFPTATPTFLNDLDITRNAVYATDSLNQRLAVDPARSTRPVAGPVGGAHDAAHR